MPEIVIPLCKCTRRREGRRKREREREREMDVWTDYMSWLKPAVHVKHIIARLHNNIMTNRLVYFSVLAAVFYIVYIACIWLSSNILSPCTVPICPLVLHSLWY